jgi:putative tryptophan/tyrosine transport system substrate-binding protein
MAAVEFDCDKPNDGALPSRLREPGHGAHAATGVGGATQNAGRPAQTFGGHDRRGHQALAQARELGWIEGQNLIVERRYASGKAELLRPYAEELVRLNVEVILTFGTAATIAARNATTRIPIVMVSAADPVRSGLVASLARPGGNITGFSMVAPDLDAKRVALLRELLPTAQRVGVLVNRANPYDEIVREENERMYRSLGLQPIIVYVAAASELENTVAEAAQRRAQALVVSPDSLFNSNGAVIMRNALKHALPTVVADTDVLEAGGLLCLETDDAEVIRVSAYFVDKILRRAKPADLPVQQPTKFVLSINLKTAKALGLTIPQALLRADKIIE